MPSTSNERPDDDEMAVLRNVRAGRQVYDGLDSQVALQAMFRCTSNGWISHGNLTPAGAALVGQIRKANYIITIIKEPKT